MNRTAVCFGLLLCALGANISELLASDPVGVYAIIDKVVFEPDAAKPDRIQVWGVFAVSDGKSGSAYLSPQKGYLYFTLPKGKEDIARKEWADLKSVAGQDKGVAFGIRYGTKVRVRGANEKVGEPDSYPIGNGVTKVEAGPTMSDLRRLSQRP